MLLRGYRCWYWAVLKSVEIKAGIQAALILRKDSMLARGPILSILLQHDINHSHGKCQAEWRAETHGSRISFTVVPSGRMRRSGANGHAGRALTSIH